MRSMKKRRLSRRDIRAIESIAARKGCNEAEIDYIIDEINGRLVELDEIDRLKKRNPIGFC